MKSCTPGATLNRYGSGGKPSASAAPPETIGTLNSEASDFTASADDELMNR